MSDKSSIDSVLSMSTGMSTGMSTLSPRRTLATSGYTTSGSIHTRLPWADQPFGLIQTPAVKLRGNKDIQISSPAAHMANESAHLFNAMLRGLNAIYQQAAYIEGQLDVYDFSFLVHSWAAWVKHHVEIRSGLLFPGLEAALVKPVPGYRHEQILQRKNEDGKPIHQLTLTAEFRAQTATFLPALNNILGLCEGIYSKAQPYKSDDLLTLLQDLGPPLQAHMASQVNITFLEIIYAYAGKPGTVSAQVTTERLLQCWNACDAQSGVEMDRFVILPLLIRCRDITYETGHDWPSLPVHNVHAIEDVLSKRHQGSWRFLPCTVWGKPVRLHALIAAAQEKELNLDRAANASSSNISQTIKGKRKGMGTVDEKEEEFAVQQMMASFLATPAKGKD